MSSGRRTNEQQATYTRQATILRKNLLEWDRMLRTPRGEDWPTMLGRLNAALNQTVNLDKSIDDVMEHFVYLPKQATANPQDIPFFLSTRLELPGDDSGGHTEDASTLNVKFDPVERLTKFERNAAKLAAQYEENMVRF
jgi:hypothetical protein